MRQLWQRQIRGVMRLELGKTLFVWRAAPLYLLAALPVLLVGLMVLSALVFLEPHNQHPLYSINSAGIWFAQVYQFLLRFTLYAGCVWMFMNLFRGDVLDRSLHYYFLAPIRREVLVVGKFVSGWLAATILFAASTLGSLALFYGYFGVGAAARFLLGPGLGHLLAYLGVTTLACLGYGAVFLVIGLFLRNPIVPAMLIWVWEWANPFLPALLKKFSVIFYLQGMLPVAINEGPFAVLADPVPAWLAIPGLIVFAVVTLVAAALRIRVMEIAYGAD